MEVGGRGIHPEGDVLRQRESVNGHHIFAIYDQPLILMVPVSQDGQSKYTPGGGGWDRWGEVWVVVWGVH